MATQTITEESRPSMSNGTVDPETIDVPRGTTTSTLFFFKAPEDGAVPFNYVEQPPEGQPQRNFGFDEHEVSIEDIRGREGDFDMNVNGFGVIGGAQGKATDWHDDEHVKSTYYPEVERVLLDNVPGARRVFIFDHTVRGSGPDSRRAPVTRAHIDQTTESAVMRVHHHMGAEADELLRQRVRLVNVWRPLNGPVVATPLAFADSRSVPDANVVPVEHRYPDRTGLTAGVRYTPAARWHYWSGMRNDERILLQCYDSQDGARTPHTAFKHPRTQDGWPGRESIEVRALVFG